MQTLAHHLYVALIGLALALGSTACATSSSQTCTSLNLWGAPGYRCTTPVAAAEADEPDEPDEPEESDEPEEPASKVVVKDDKIEILERVQFETNSAEILGESHSLLNEVATTMNDNPGITALRVEGFTDNRGSRDLNRKLSQDRADAVRSYLIEHGVDGGRLTAKGFGPDEPIGDNDTEAGREQNRRVEFHIMARE